MSPIARTLDFVNKQIIQQLPVPVLMLSVGIGIFTSLVLYQLVLYPFLLSPLRKLSGPPLGPNLLIGRFGEIIRGEAGIPQREWIKKYGKTIRVVGPFGLQRLIFTSSEALQKILPKFMRDTLGIVAGYGLLTVTGNVHRQMRRAMNPAFSIPSLTAQTDMYHDALDGLVEILDEKITAEEEKVGAGQGIVEKMYIWMSKVTLDIICLSAFGYETDSLHNPHNELAEAYEELIKLQTGYNLTLFIVILSIPGVPKLLTSEWAWRHRKSIAKLPFLDKASIMIDCMHRIKAVSAGILAQKLKEAEGVDSYDTTAKKDIMSLLVRARKAEEESREKEKVTLGTGVVAGPEPYRMSNEEMMDQVLTFLGAGHETTASGLAWTLWLLANDQASQQKLREEVTSLFEVTNTEKGSKIRKGRPGYRELKDLVWLDAVVMESLRIYPPVPMTFRQAATTDYIDGVLVPKGTLFYVPIRVVNTLVDIWGEDAEEFRPSRWLPGNVPEKYNTNPSLSMMSFLAGPHACIGKTMAIVEMKAVLAALIANFEFEPAYAGQKAVPTAAVTMKPADDMPLRVRKVRI
ncbi:cytochrome P450 [Dendrothele bispora CBS 962.96]|uniref:Cytochrome P450 n=1 Tax=Dendrothele bispora (strain CBS 962.96) TaxID=1314807 RepID=A0A4S8KZ80_DENBC|nr:cytochrome P450 [Dendrothele bispora CBS 962.96]